jgi:hypothetical protein
VIAHVKLAEVLWRASCPVAGSDGACIEIIRPPVGHAAIIAQRNAARRKGHRAAAESCGVGVSIIVHERRSAPAAEAMSHFEQALKLYRDGTAQKEVATLATGAAARLRELDYHAAQARMAQGDAEYEHFLRMKLPAGLDFKRGAERARKRFAEWFAAKQDQMERARQAYLGVILMKQPHWAIAASARVGQLFEDFSAQLYTSPIPSPPAAPPGVRAADWADDFRTAYCDGIGDQITVLEDKAVAALDLCLHKATEWSWYSEWSSLCETELNQLRPIEYPLASEIRAEPGYLSAPVDRAPVVAKLGE